MEENKINEDKLEEFDEESVIDKVIERYDLDPLDDEDLIVKLVASEKESYQKLSKAIGQKIDYRKKFEEAQKSSTPKEESLKESAKVDGTPDVSKAVQEALDKRDLEELGLPEDLERELKKLASIQNISIKKAMNDPYFVYKKEQHENSDLTAKASISKKNTGSQYSSGDNSEVPQVDLSTTEGRKAWEDYKKSLEGKK